MIDLYEQISDDAFEGILTALRIRSEKSDFSIEEIKGELESLYKYEGLGWAGRGDYKQAEIEGSILAFQVFISEFEEDAVTN
jgi:hypothetical protein